VKLILSILLVLKELKKLVPKEIDYYKEQILINLY